MESGGFLCPFCLKNTPCTCVNQSWIWISSSIHHAFIFHLIIKTLHRQLPGDLLCYLCPFCLRIFYTVGCCASVQCVLTSKRMWYGVRAAVTLWPPGFLVSSIWEVLYHSLFYNQQDAPWRMWGSGPCKGLSIWGTSTSAWKMHSAHQICWPDSKWLALVVGKEKSQWKSQLWGLSSGNICSRMSVVEKNR